MKGLEQLGLGLICSSKKWIGTVLLVKNWILFFLNLNQNFQSWFLACQHKNRQFSNIQFSFLNVIKLSHRMMTQSWFEYAHLKSNWPFKPLETGWTKLSLVSWTKIEIGLKINRNRKWYPNPSTISSFKIIQIISIRRSHHLDCNLSIWLFVIKIMRIFIQHSKSLWVIISVFQLKWNV